MPTWHEIWRQPRLQLPCSESTWTHTSVSGDWIASNLTSSFWLVIQDCSVIRMYCNWQTQTLFLKKDRAIQRRDRSSYMRIAISLCLAMAMSCSPCSLTFSARTIILADSCCFRRATLFDLSISRKGKGARCDEVAFSDRQYSCFESCLTGGILFSNVYGANRQDAVLEPKGDACRLLEVALRSARDDLASSMQSKIPVIQVIQKGWYEEARKAPRKVYRRGRPPFDLSICPFAGWCGCSATLERNMWRQS